MHATHLRYLLHLHGPKVVVLGVLLLTTLQQAHSQSQGYTRRYMEFYDDKPIRYGFLFAMPLTRFNLQHSNAFLNADSAFLIQSPVKAGFRMGFTVNAALSKHFDLRTTPSVTLYERQVKYSYPGGTEKIETRESTWIEIPLLVKFKSVRRANSRMYMLAGATFGVETNVRRQRANNFNSLSTQSTDLTLDYGVGFEQFFEFFKFAPELRFSHGMGNMLLPADNSVSVGINRLSTHTVTLYLNFE